MAQKGRRHAIDLQEIDGVYQLPSPLPYIPAVGPYYSLITGSIILPPPKEELLALPPPPSIPFSRKNVEPKYVGKSDYIDFGKPKEPAKKEISNDFDPVKLFIKCIRKELRKKKSINKAGKYTLVNTIDESTDMSRVLKRSLEIKLRAMGLDPIKIETSFRKKALRRGGRKHAKGGWMYEPATNSYIRTKTRPGTTGIKVHKKDSKSYYGSTKTGLPHVG